MEVEEEFVQCSLGRFTNDEFEDWAEENSEKIESIGNGSSVGFNKFLFPFFMFLIFVFLVVVSVILVSKNNRKN